MNKLDYVNKLLDADDISDYINKIEKDNSISPPSDLKDKILKTCYSSTINTKTEAKATKRKISFIDVIKVACFALVITLCTELFMSATYASTKETNSKTKNNDAIHKVYNKIDNVMSDFSEFMLNSDLKGE